MPRPLLRLLHRAYDPYYYWRIRRIGRRLVQRVFHGRELIVATGPFQGMKYLPVETASSALVPKLLGAYERELHGALDTITGRHYDTVINIGCADGYYLVGLALRLPQAVMHGFDLDEHALSICRRLGELNGVSRRLNLHGRCTSEDFASLLGRRTLVLCDCEGAEVELLDPRRAPRLVSADVLVELHDHLVPNASTIVARRFAASHRVEVIHTEPRDASAYPLLAALAPQDQMLALEEFRGGPMSWAFMSPLG